MNANKASYRILCIGEMWLGSNARAAFMALRRLGHSIQVIDEHLYHPAPWRSTPLRIARRLLRPLLVRELSREARRRAEIFRPHGVFVFKGNAVHPDLIRHFKSRGIPTLNFYPDVSFWTHGPYIPRALPLYDHVFTTKSWGIKDLKEQLGVEKFTFVEHGFDPEMDRAIPLAESDRQRYECDVVFIGTWSPKKEMLLAHLKRAAPGIRISIWGSYWEKQTARELKASIVGQTVEGDEYIKALLGASISLGLLSEQRTGASSGDLITSRTFNIPACGAFMLHERNNEAVRYFAEDQEAAFFETPDELVRQVSFYLANPDKRKNVAAAGQARALKSGYSLDSRMATVVRYLDERLSS